MDGILEVRVDKSTIKRAKYAWVRVDERWLDQKKDRAGSLGCCSIISRGLEGGIDHNAKILRWSDRWDGRAAGIEREEIGKVITNTKVGTLAGVQR